MALNKLHHHGIGYCTTCIQACFSKDQRQEIDWNLSCVFAETAALFAIYLMPCLFFVARIDWMNSGSVAMSVIYLVGGG